MKSCKRNELSERVDVGQNTEISLGFSQNFQCLSRASVLTMPYHNVARVPQVGYPCPVYARITTNSIAYQ